MSNSKPQIDSAPVNKVRTSLWLIALVALCALITSQVVRQNADRDIAITNADASHAETAKVGKSTSTPRVHRPAAAEAPIESPSELTFAEAREADRLLAERLREELGADPKNVSEILDLIRKEKDPNRLFMLASIITGFPEA